MDNHAQSLASLIKNSKSTVFFGGAGVSTESGIPDFRSANGIFHAEKAFGHPPEVLLSHSFFLRQPAVFFRYYKDNLIALHAEPNEAHITLAKLEDRGLLNAIITQNIDGLHQRAGSRNVLELHGSNWRQYCMQCGKKYTLEYILDPAHCRDGILPICAACNHIVRPDVVLYEEGLDDHIMKAAIDAIEAADLLIVGGTSLAVYPAAGLLRYFHGDNLVLVNKSETPYDRHAQLVLHENIAYVFSDVAQILHLP